MSTTRMPSIVICIKAETIVQNFDDVYVIHKSTATVRILLCQNSRKDENKMGRSGEKTLHSAVIYDYIALLRVTFHLNVNTNISSCHI